MPKSMTGYGMASVETDSYRITVELRSVNHRYLEISLRLGRSMMAWEDSFRKLIRGKLARGKVDVYIILETRAEEERVLKVNHDLAGAYARELAVLAKELALTPVTDTLSVAALPEVMTIVDSDGPFLSQEVALEVLEIALANLAAMRVQEGTALTNDLYRRLVLLENNVREIETMAPAIGIQYEDALRKRLSEYLSDIDIDEVRIIQEVAIFSDKINVNEEIVRIYSHLNQFRDILGADDEPVGRKLDFLIQEINREINTIGSKLSDVAIAKLVVAMKSEVEKLREQVQNLE